jgi:calcineurin-like phosphoesterase family protein
MKIQINNKQNVFFCSDPHYGHSGIVMGTSKWDDKSGCRPFQTVEDHDRILVNNINRTVGENDILFCLGDWSFGSYKTGENITNIRKFREQIKCKNIYLTFGNHDSEILSNKDNTRDLFSSTAHYREITIIEQPLGQGEKAKKQNIVLSHYSHRVWNNMQSGAWMLFGHSHGNLGEVQGKTMDVGFDTNDLKPYSYSEIKEIMSRKETVSIDHHK